MKIFKYKAIVLALSLIVTASMAEDFDIRVDGWNLSGHKTYNKCQTIQESMGSSGQCRSLLKSACGFSIWAGPKTATRVTNLKNSGHEVRVYHIPSGRYECKSN